MRAPHPSCRYLSVWLSAVGAVMAFSFGFLAEGRADEALLKIPDGYVEGLVDAKYGAYGSAFAVNARQLQRRLTHLENKVMGLAKLANESPLRQSEIVFVLEAAVLRFHMDVAASSDQVLTAFERESLLYSSVRLYSQLRMHAERLFEDMVRLIDVKFPGPNGLQMREELKGSSESVYLPNYRTSETLSESERARLYRQKLDEFRAQGGSLDEMVRLTPEYLAGLGPYTRLEYVVRANGEAWVTAGKAGHILLAGGGAAKSGGQVIFLKNPRGEFTLVVVSSASGSFKPDILSAQQAGELFRGMVGVGFDRVVITKGEPMGLQAVKIFSRGLGLESRDAKARLERLIKIDDQLRSYRNRVSAPRSCRDLFAS